MADPSMIEALAGFVRDVESVDVGRDIAVRLSAALVEQADVQSFAVFEMNHDGKLERIIDRDILQEATAPNLDGLEDFARRARAASNGRFTRFTVRTVTSEGEGIAAIVILHDEPDTTCRVKAACASAILDIATMAYVRAHKRATVERMHAQLKTSQEILDRSEKLRSLGEMAAGVSHDLKGILNGLSLPLQALKREIDLSDPATLELVKAMEQTVARGIDTVERLREFSRQSPGSPALPEEVDPLLQEAIRLIRPRLMSAPHTIRLHTDFGRPPKIVVHTSEMITAIMNVLHNAIDAFDCSGDIHVSSRAETGAHGDEAVVEITDTGPGMPPEVARRIFQPFFTTKGARGTGLGLSMVYAFARRHFGTVSVRTEVGKGTTFELRFPAARASTFILAIDGPAGAGKSTVATAVAKRLGLELVDTGALYRTTALIAMRSQLAAEDQIADALSQHQIVLERARVWLDNEDVSLAIRAPEISALSSRVAAMPAVRRALLDVQRQVAHRSPVGAVVEGRDIGTVVFPDAQLKIFLTASIAARAQRRKDELSARGETHDVADVEQEIVRRDTLDAGRSVAPLRAAPDAVHIDTTGRTVDAIVEEIVALAAKRTAREFPASSEARSAS